MYVFNTFVNYSLLFFSLHFTCTKSPPLARRDLMRTTLRVLMLVAIRLRGPTTKRAQATQGMTKAAWRQALDWARMMKTPTLLPRSLLLWPTDSEGCSPGISLTVPSQLPSLPNRHVPFPRSQRPGRVRNGLPSLKPELYQNYMWCGIHSSQYHDGYPRSSQNQF